MEMSRIKKKMDEIQTVNDKMKAEVTSLVKSKKFLNTKVFIFDEEDPRFPKVPNDSLEPVKAEMKNLDTKDSDLKDIENKVDKIEVFQPNLA